MSTALLAGSLTAAAQETKTEIDYVPNWYVGAQVGGQYTLGEIKFGDLLSPNAQVLVGYNFNPVMGLRLGVNAWQSKAGLTSHHDLPDVGWKWNYVAPNIDATVNLSNLVAGFNPKRVANLSLFAGIGANIGWGNDEAFAVKVSGRETQNEPLRYYWDGTQVLFQGRAGLDLDFRLTDNWQLGAEVSANVLSDKYNSKNSDNADWYFNALVGVKYTIGKSYTKREVEIPQVEPKVIEKIVEKIVEKTVEKPVPTQQVATIEPLRVDIFFTISSTSITAAEGLKVKEVANYLKKHPEATVEVTGYADKGTGKAEGNMKLSQRRADIVVDALKKAGVSANRIKASYKGDTVQPFDINDLNRVSICIAK